MILSERCLSLTLSFYISLTSITIHSGEYCPIFNNCNKLVYNFTTFFYFYLLPLTSVCITSPTLPSMLVLQRWLDTASSPQKYSIGQHQVGKLVGSSSLVLPPSSPSSPSSPSYPSLTASSTIWYTYLTTIITDLFFTSYFFIFIPFYHFIHYTLPLTHNSWISLHNSLDRHW